jgi:hypothetical protein
MDGPNYTWAGRMRLAKVNKASFEGRKTQTKRYTALGPSSWSSSLT